MIAKYLVCFKSGSVTGAVSHTTMSTGRYNLRKPKPDLESIMDFLKEEYGDNYEITSISEIK